MGERLKLEFHDTDVTISKYSKYFNISKSYDGDIWFSSSDNDMEILIGYDYDEFNLHCTFYDCMKRIVGNYILSGDSSDTFNLLPEDFIDLENKIITFHSDLGNNNSLKLQLVDNMISISLNNNSDNKSSKQGVKVRIRTSGSNYGNYYIELEKLYNELLMFKSIEKEIGVGAKRCRKRKNIINRIYDK